MRDISTSDSGKWPTIGISWRPTGMKKSGTFSDRSKWRYYTTLCDSIAAPTTVMLFSSLVALFPALLGLWSRPDCLTPRNYIRVSGSVTYRCKPVPEVIWRTTRWSDSFSVVRRGRVVLSNLQNIPMSYYSISIPSQKCKVRLLKYP